jgi:hypothetical protein
MLVGKPEGRRPLGRPRRRWVNKIETALGRKSREDCIDLAQISDQFRAF